MVFEGNVPSVGLDKLDQEHREIFNSSEALKDAAASDMPAKELLKIFGEVLGTVVEHFESEEAILAPYRLSNMQSHIDEHASLTKSLVALGENAVNGLPESEWRPVLVGLSDRLFDHIVTFDFEVRRHIADYGRA